MTVFISREISSGSLFKMILEPAGFEIIDRSLVNFSAVPFTALPPTDWLFFYSKRGVNFFFEQLENQLDATIRIGAIGPATAKQVEQYNYKVDFIGNGVPEATARDFIGVCNSENTRNRVVVFPQAKNSRRSIQKLLDQEIRTLDLIVYDNEISERVKIPHTDILVFTSPMNVLAYLESNQIHESQKIVAIGLTTALFLKQKGFKAVHIADMPSEKSMAEKVLEIS